MSDADDFESASAAIDGDADGPPSAHGRKAPPAADALLPARPVAASLGRTDRTLRNWERRGWLLPVRIGRSVFYRPSDIEALAAHGAPTPADKADFGVRASLGRAQERRR